MNLPYNEQFLVPDPGPLLGSFDRLPAISRGCFDLESVGERRRAIGGDRGRGNADVNPDRFPDGVRPVRLLGVLLESFRLVGDKKERIKAELVTGAVGFGLVVRGRSCLVVTEREAATRRSDGRQDRPESDEPSS